MHLPMCFGTFLVYYMHGHRTEPDGQPNQRVIGHMASTLICTSAMHIHMRAQVITPDRSRYTREEQRLLENQLLDVEL
jgi:hypothetical protein